VSEVGHVCPKTRSASVSDESLLFQRPNPLLQELPLRLLLVQGRRPLIREARASAVLPSLRYISAQCGIHHPVRGPKRLVSNGAHFAGLMSSNGVQES
jgi:hypothetical protein